jgi:molybdopterin-binding protein|tara:strand:- start:2190 stop:2432 length:243 start_codon:yes stop_codon:yes gene_type:complete
MTKEKIVITPVITKEQLRFEVDKLVYGDGMTYTESIIEICERMEIDPEDMAKLVKGPLKSKLEVEAMDRNIIKRTTTELY